MPHRAGKSLSKKSTRITKGKKKIPLDKINLDRKKSKHGGRRSKAK